MSKNHPAQFFLGLMHPAYLATIPGSHMATAAKKSTAKITARMTPMKGMTSIDRSRIDAPEIALTMKRPARAHLEQRAIEPAPGVL